jgi:hypothetical protein
MPNQTITGMRTAGKKQVPGGTRVILHNPGIPGQANVQLQLPGAEGFADLGAVPIIDREIVLPVFTVFLCHAREDAKVVEKVSKRLWEHGFVTWFDKKDLLPGDDWEQRIREAIQSSDYFLVFLSSQSCTKTGFVQKEMRLAFELRELMPDGKRFIIPVLIDDCIPPSRFGAIQWVRMAEKDWYERLVRALKQQ